MKENICYFQGIQFLFSYKVEYNITNYNRYYSSEHFLCFFLHVILFSCGVVSINNFKNAVHLSLESYNSFLKCVFLNKCINILNCIYLQ